MTRERQNTNERLCMSETAAKFDMPTILRMMHRDRQRENSENWSGKRVSGSGRELCPCNRGSCRELCPSNSQKFKWSVEGKENYQHTKTARLRTSQIHSH
jgi:hypothetical protein